jgi:hypothetical protein
VTLFLKFLLFKRRKGMTNSITQKTAKNGAFSIEMASYIIIKGLILRNGPRGRLALNTSFQIKKNI